MLEPARSQTWLFWFDIKMELAAVAFLGRSGWKETRRLPPTTIPLPRPTRRPRLPLAFGAVTDRARPTSLVPALCELILKEKARTRAMERALKKVNNTTKKVNDPLRVRGLARLWSKSPRSFCMIYYWLKGFYMWFGIIFALAYLFYLALAGGSLPRFALSFANPC